MVIELSGVQFGLKSNWTRAQGEFDLNSEVWFQTKIARPEVQLHFVRSILKSHNLIAKYVKQWLLVFHFPAISLVSFKKAFKSDS